VRTVIAAIPLLLLLACRPAPVERAYTPRGAGDESAEGAGAERPPSVAPTPDTGAAAAPASVDTQVADVMRIAFGSCNDLSQPQLLWGHIAALHPDVWVWLGDNVYADTQDMAEMRLHYDRTRAEPGYAALLRQTRVIGTWDDHDYGANNAGKEYPKRAQAQQVLLDFLGEPQDSPRRKQAGVYASYDFGEGERIVRVILLDTRYHRDAPGPHGDVLGDAQWAWLQDQLTDSPAAVHVLGTSFQLVAQSHPHEKWANFPSARARMLALIGISGARNPVVISGDRHYAELSKTELPYGGELYDLTASSLSRPWDRDPREANPDRVGPYYWHVNFGLLEVDWLARELRLQVRGQDGEPKIQHAIPLGP
jgi:alkaline phosphatase D